ncbi:hypothetical protein Agub_g6537 [Astrephomene gubernaculifera]|uniref:MHD2 domain-containing protein n=1 Tax=Astrephomene gubernaculifera TaxID=47775 RepID=A0AAD3HKX9_9CHLO|nr:hypothetical protein Agub_g6537 [Astrephomene gubernaculifera]
MNRDVWAERRELLEYLLKDHARRGGKIIGPQQGLLYDAKVLDQVNVTALLKQLQAGGAVDIARATGPPPVISSPGPRPPLGPSSSSSRFPTAGDNPFGPPQPAAAGGASGRSVPGDNPFGPPPGSSLGGSNGAAAVPAAASSRHMHHVSADNPFGGPSDGGGGGGNANPFGSTPAGKRPSSGAGAGGTITAADAAMFSKTRSKKVSAGSGGGMLDPPVTAVATATKLSYNLTTAPSPSRPQQQRGGPAGEYDGGAVHRVSDGDRSGGGGGVGGDMDDGAGGIRPPPLDLPQLETGQTEDQLRDLAFLLFAACASGTGLPQHSALLPVVRQQLLVEEGRAADIGRVLRHIQPGGEPTLLDALHPAHPPSSSPPAGSRHASAAGLWRPSQRASLELLLRLIAVVRPTDFEGGSNNNTGSATSHPSASAAGSGSAPGVISHRAFRGFLRWKDVTVAVLERQLALAVEAGWSGERPQLRKMLARMHGAARRADVRGEGDFEEEEYGEATRVLAEVAGRLAEGCATGMRFPWAVRVRLCEILITAIFDSLEPGVYIDEAALVLQFLESVMWPALGLSAPAALAVSAWVHFSMYVATGCREQRLVKHLKQLIARLAAAAAEAPMKGSDPFGLGPEATGAAVPSACGGGSYGGTAAPSAPAEELARDTALAAQVADRIVEWVYDKLCDYHAAFPKGENMSALLDVFVFAARSRGDPPERLAALLAAAVADSTAAQFGRLMRARVDTEGSNETRLLQLASVVHDIADAAESLFCGALLAPHLPAALPVAAAHLHGLYGSHLAPWLHTVGGISPAVLDVFRTANALEQRLTAHIAKAGPPPPPAAAAAAPGAVPPPAPAGAAAAAATPVATPTKSVSSGGNAGALGAAGSSFSSAKKDGANGSSSSASAGGEAAAASKTPSPVFPGGGAAPTAVPTPAAAAGAGSGSLYPPVPSCAPVAQPHPHPGVVYEVLSAHRRWDLAGPLKGAMLQWVSSQVASMNTWAARALQAEKWRPMGSGPDASHTQSAVDVSRMSFEAVEALYGMDVPMPPEVPYALLDGIDAVLRKYVTHVNEKLGDLQRVMPPLPPLTRYKKDVVVKQEHAEMEAGRGSAKGKQKVAFLASVPTVESSPELTNMSASLTPEALAAAAGSLHYLGGRAEALRELCRERQQQSVAAHSAANPSTAGKASSKQLLLAEAPSSSPEPSEPPLSQARTALSAGMQYACKFLATRIVFWDQRANWLELLYRHHVTAPGARIEPQLEALNKVLGALCPAMQEAVRNAFARHLLIAAVQAMERVLLDGGPCRWFTPADVTAIEQDLFKLRSLFHAEGEGLEREVIDGELERLRRLLPLMKLEVGPLMDLLKTARTHGTAQLTASNGAPGAAFDESSLMRVIAHRPERNGSKLLKTLYKLPKKPK